MSDERKKLLMIVDPQIDFISGTLTVEGAEKAMLALSDYVADNGAALYSDIIVTADRHPFNHCSFICCGGEWERHCVHDSVGAAILPPLMEVLYDFHGNIHFLYKGEKKDIEEYSIFKNRDAAKRIADIISDKGIEEIDICGIAGDVCVSDTLLDGIRLLPNIKFNVLRRFCPSIDGGERLDGIVSKYHIPCDR